MRKRTIVWVTSILCLLPIAYAMAVYPSLPAQIAIHWNSAGVADRHVHKAVAAYGLPILFLAINLYSKLRLLNDPRGAGRSVVIEQLSIWLIPATAMVLIPVTLLIAMGAAIPLDMIAMLVIGVLLLVIGNFLPKSRQSYTIGIKLPWTLADADNWNRTHRLAGYLWMAGGLLLILSSLLLPGTTAHIAVIAVVALLVLLPMAYSYVLFKRGNSGNPGKM